MPGPRLVICSPNPVPSDASSGYKETVSWRRDIFLELIVAGRGRKEQLSLLWILKATQATEKPRGAQAVPAAVRASGSGERAAGGRRGERASCPGRPDSGRWPRLPAAPGLGSRVAAGSSRAWPCPGVSPSRALVRSQLPADPAVEVASPWVPSGRCTRVCVSLSLLGSLTAEKTVCWEGAHSRHLHGFLGPHPEVLPARLGLSRDPCRTPGAPGMAVFHGTWASGACPKLCSPRSVLGPPLGPGLTRGSQPRRTGPVGVAGRTGVLGGVRAAPLARGRLSHVDVSLFPSVPPTLSKNQWEKYSKRWAPATVTETLSSRREASHCPGPPRPSEEGGLCPRDTLLPPVSKEGFTCAPFPPTESRRRRG